NRLYYSLISVLITCAITTVNFIVMGQIVAYSTGASDDPVNLSGLLIVALLALPVIIASILHSIWILIYKLDFVATTFKISKPKLEYITSIGLCVVAAGLIYIISL